MYGVYLYMAHYCPNGKRYINPSLCSGGYMHGFAPKFNLFKSGKNVFCVARR